MSRVCTNYGKIRKIRSSWNTVLWTIYPIKQHLQTNDIYKYVYVYIKYIYHLREKLYKLFKFYITE